MKTITTFLALTAATLLLASPLWANNCCATHSEQPAAAQVAEGKTDPHAGMAMGKEEGKEKKDFFKETRDGYTFRYDALPMSVKGATHHLMVYVTDKEGKPVTGAKVGYQVSGPDKKVQQVMAMEMGDGYGGNLDLTVKGAYAFRTKVVTAGGATVNHEFTKDIQ